MYSYFGHQRPVIFIGISWCSAINLCTWLSYRHIVITQSDVVVDPGTIVSNSVKKTILESVK